MTDLTVWMLLSFIGLGWWLWLYEQREDTEHSQVSAQLLRRERRKAKRDAQRPGRRRYYGALILKGSKKPHGC